MYHLYWCWIEVLQKEFEYEHVYHELYNYGHFWQFMSLNWLLLQLNWYMESIWILLLNWWLICMWKSNSHILLWSFEVNDVNELFYLMMCPCGQKLKNEVLMLLSHYFDYIDYVDSYTLTLGLYYYFFYMSVEYFRVSCGILT